ncbi:MAG: DNA-binding response regulator [Chloroflexi bacterium]|nr:MAG: DNA-binding response regulator [Chloroflexota bacterium]MBL1197352.1 DNA-binding response regulator [Chloroflexota bacterium]NOH14649.1 response regulator transcription factor [Chloroflexota bacterium]
MIIASTLAVRAGLRALLGSDEEIEIIDEATDFDAIETLPPSCDVIVSTADAFAPDGMQDLLAEVEAPPALLLMTDEAGSLEGLASQPLRAWGVLPLDASEEELLAAVKALHEGLLAGAPPLMQPLLGQAVGLTNDLDLLVEDLTPRENEVLHLLSQGLANKQIAYQLDISEHTVKFHISSIYTKLGATNRTEAVRIGAQLGLIVF